MNNTKSYSFLDGTEFILYNQGDYIINGKVYKLNNNKFRISDGDSFVNYLRVLLDDSTLTFTKSDLCSLDDKVNLLINNPANIQKLLESMHIHKII